MKFLRTEEWGLPSVLDRDLPEDCQYTKSIDIFQGYRCMQCGDIITEECDMVGHKCKNDPSDWELIEVNKYGQDIEELLEVE